MTRTFDRQRPRAAQGTHLAFLQHAQQLDLEGRRCLADFVEEDGAAVGLLEEADAVLVGAGEGAALVAEQLGFEQLVRQRAAVLDDEALVAATAAVVDGACQQFLAGARFAGDEHRDVVRRHTLRQFADLVQRAAGRAHQAVHGELLARLAAPVLDALAQRRRTFAQFQRQALVLLLQAVGVDRAAQRQQQLVRPPGLEQVLPDAGLVDAGNDALPLR